MNKPLFSTGRRALAPIVAVALLSGAAPAGAVLPQQSGAVDLLSQANVQLDGAASFDFSGRSVAGAGDVNGDGLADLIVGAPYADPHGGHSGSAYVVFGQASPAKLDLGALGSGGFRIDGATAGGQAGASVAGAGDVNGDGLADVVVGAPYTSNNGCTRTGATCQYGNRTGSAYVVFGQDSEATVDLAALGSHGFQIGGAAAYGLAGVSVAGAGDVNRDGLADVIVGSVAGSAYVVLGKISTAAVSLADLAGGGFRIEGSADESSGAAVTGAGDVNGDGLPDVAVGAPGASPNGAGSGAAYVVFGQATLPDTVSLDDLGSGGFRIDGAAEGSEAGISVAGADDMNGDGLADVLVGSSSGSAFAVFGKASNAAVDLAGLGAAGIRMDGAADDYAGYSVAGAGDVNGDGLADAAVGALGSGFNGRESSGSAYVVFGQHSGTTVDLAALDSRGFRIDGAAAGDFAGVSVGGAGDVNGDGRPDVIVGAPYASNNDRPISGSTYVTYGFGVPQLSYDPNSLIARVGAPIAPVVPVIRRTGDASFVVTPALPAGLSLDPSSGGLSGTPLEPQSAAMYTVTMSDLAGVAETSLSIRVDAQPAGPPAQQPAGPAVSVPQRASVRVLSRSVRITRRGVAKILLACSAAAGDGCEGNLTLRTVGRIKFRGKRARKVTLGRSSFSVPGGHSAAVRVRLSRNSRRLIARQGRIRVAVSAATRGTSGVTVQSAGTIVLKSPRGPTPA